MLVMDVVTVMLDSRVSGDAISLFWFSPQLVEVVLQESAEYPGKPAGSKKNIATAI
jgi:hypothetical protein